MSIYVCAECGMYKDADDGGCEETSDGMGLICEDCYLEMTAGPQDIQYACEHCENLAVIMLDGDLLCQTHADQWVRNEGQSEHAAQQDQTA